MRASRVKREGSPQQRGWPVPIRLAEKAKGPFPRPRGDAHGYQPPGRVRPWLSGELTLSTVSVEVFMCLGSACPRRNESDELPGPRLRAPSICVPGM